MKILNKAEIEAAEKVLLKHLPKSFKVVLILKANLELHPNAIAHDVTSTGLRLPSRY